VAEKAFKAVAQISVIESRRSEAETDIDEPPKGVEFVIIFALSPYAPLDNH